ncbi:probable inactive ATP-dependent zinc metalloprotease FTSHI 4, chloroplastic [Telopea speciosissima]|uniref:probable inactive ATP-dependent zinc metalloprotease FTSHI 4, chloroplastic n=1 Tax=Telopea speciosissima TaxID=54955 RepID=UPI001CC60F31|nr:probable inactive ATP-dependent zinc metalloprotease FTSHI 4, chloroplastic [Telopea speciosissima]
MARVDFGAVIAEDSTGNVYAVKLFNGKQKGKNKCPQKNNDALKYKQNPTLGFGLVFVFSRFLTGALEKAFESPTKEGNDVNTGEKEADEGFQEGGAEREHGLLKILAEKDGFKVSTSQVLVIGATYQSDILDPALLRKGHPDKIIRVGLPSKDGRLDILKADLENPPFLADL